jgi:hypothetical protein
VNETCSDGRCPYPSVQGKLCYFHWKVAAGWLTHYFEADGTLTEIKLP